MILCTTLNFFCSRCLRQVWSAFSPEAHLRRQSLHQTLRPRFVTRRKARKNTGIAPARRPRERRSTQAYPPACVWEQRDSHLGEIRCYVGEQREREPSENWQMHLLFPFSAALPTRSQQNFLCSTDLPAGICLALIGLQNYSGKYLQLIFVSR